MTGLPVVTTPTTRDRTAIAPAPAHGVDNSIPFGRIAREGLGAMANDAGDTTEVVAMRRQ